MKILSINSKELVLKPTKRDENYKSFIFDIGIVPLKPTPKRIVFKRKQGKHILTWEMSWNRFEKQTCIGDVAIIAKSACKYTTKVE